MCIMEIQYDARFFMLHNCFYMVFKFSIVKKYLDNDLERMICLSLNLTG